MTREGGAGVLQHRQALLWHIAADLMPHVDPELRMPDTLAAVGGPEFVECLERLQWDDCGLATLLRSMSASAGVSTIRQRQWP